MQIETIVVDVLDVLATILCWALGFEIVGAEDETVPPGNGQQADG